MRSSTVRRVMRICLVGAGLVGGMAQAQDNVACAGYGEDVQVMLEADRALRGRQDYLAAPEDGGQARRRAQLALVERSNAMRLETLLARCGWPLRSIHGPDAGEAAWQLVRQSLALQQAAAPHLERAVAAGEADGRVLAQLLDRIALAKGEPQRYGTQMRQLDGCRWTPQPMDDRARVEERRRTLGLPGLEEQERQANVMVIHEGCENQVAMPPPQTNK